MKNTLRGPLVALVTALALTMGALAAPAGASASPTSTPTVQTSVQSPATRATDATQKKRPKHLGEVVADDTHWWGMSWQLSNAGTQRLILAVKGGASLSTIVSLFCAGSVIGVACGVADGVAAVLLFLGADILDFCNRYGRGIVLAKPWVGMPYCKSR